MQFNLWPAGQDRAQPRQRRPPRDGDPRAAYAVIEDGRIELKRIAYPVEETISRVEASPWPDRAKEMLTHVLRVGRLPAPPTDGPDPKGDEVPELSTDDDAPS